MVAESRDGSHVIVTVPASTANLGPGFDTLGLAINLHLKVELEVVTDSGQTEPSIIVEVRGRDSTLIPADKTNYIVATAEKYCLTKGKPAFTPNKSYKFTITNDIPIGKGLGSSGAATVAGVTLGMALCGEKLEQSAIYTNACLFEKHPDNISASVFGGLNVCPPNGLQPIRMHWPEELQLYIAVPNFELKTELSRSVLPPSYPLSDAVRSFHH